MAEYIFRHLCRQAGRESEFELASAAISTEEIGNDIYPPAQRTLRAHGIPFESRAARQVTAADFDYYDYVICADRANIRLLPYYTGIQPEGHPAKLSLLMTWAGEIAMSLTLGTHAISKRHIVTFSPLVRLFSHNCDFFLAYVKFFLYFCTRI